MEEKLGRVIQFLRNNNNHYFESSDIAYHLKFDEQFTDDALHYLQSIQAVTVSQDSNGKIVWYAAEHWNQPSVEEVRVDSSTIELNKDVGRSITSEKTVERVHPIHELIENVEKARKPFPVALLVVSVGIIFVIAGVSFVGKKYVDKQYMDVMAVANAAVVKTEYQEFRDQILQSDKNLSLKVNEFDSFVDSTSAKIDSLDSCAVVIKKQLADLKRYFRHH